MSEGLDTQERHFAHRGLRTWLQTSRDRLTVDVAAHFGARLPGQLPHSIRALLLQPTA